VRGPRFRFCCSSRVFVTLLLLWAAGRVFADEYTGMGAVAGGNATGEITPFTGVGALECPADYKKGMFLPNPYRQEKPLFRIDHANVDQYQGRLSPGQIARLRRNQNSFMNVYPTHRITEFADQFYRATEKSRESSRIDEKNILRGFQGGIPFPFPKNGIEAIWNVKRPYYGDDALGINCRRVVSPSGKVKRNMWTTETITYDERRLFSRLPNPDGISHKIKTVYTFPADEAGMSFLTVGYLDDNRLEDAWMYMPSLRRVRRAPSLIGGGQLDGECTMDELGWEFRGPVNDWHWKLLGLREMYIPVNNFDLWEVGGTDEEECLAGDINPGRARYELRRVWVVEGTAREGLNHPYSRRVGYYDEDTWQPSASDRYDVRGNLWRTAEYYTSYDYCERIRLIPAIIYLNLESGRYELFGGCRTEKTFTSIYNTNLPESHFTVQALRTAGR